MHHASQEMQGRISCLLSEVETRLDEGFPEEALAIAVETQKLMRRVELDHQELKVDLQYLLGSCYFDLRRWAKALIAYQEIRQFDERDTEVDYWEARAYFHSWRFQEAKRLFDRYQPSVQNRGAALYYHALTSDFLGDHRTADSLFVQSEVENPTDYPRPLRISHEDAKSIFYETLDSLPLEVRPSLRQVKIRMLPLPDFKLHASPDVDPLDPGLYRKAETARVTHYIELFQRNLERISADQDEFREELRVTLTNTLGQFLGDDQDFGRRHTSN